SRLGGRVRLLDQIDSQRKMLDQVASRANLDPLRQAAISMLVDRRVRNALDVTQAPQAIQDRYGRNAFGWSLLMARRLVEAGVNLARINVGNNETWDTPGNAL